MLKTVSHTFSVSERLKSRKVIAALFKDGQSLMAYPVRVVWRYSENADDVHAQVAISVSKRFFKTAVERNLLKRRIREAYRLNKHELYKCLSTSGKQLSLILIYVAKEPLEYAEIEAGIKKMIRKFNQLYCD